MPINKSTLILTSDDSPGGADSDEDSGWVAELRRETAGSRWIVTPPNTSDLYTSNTSDDLASDEEVSDEPLSCSPATP